jgi:hypothetical protein
LAGSMLTQRSSRRTAAHQLPFCSSIKPQACSGMGLAAASRAEGESGLHWLQDRAAMRAWQVLPP